MDPKIESGIQMWFSGIETADSVLPFCDSCSPQRKMRVCHRLLFHWLETQDGPGIDLRCCLLH